MGSPTTACRGSGRRSGPSGGTGGPRTPAVFPSRWGPPPLTAREFTNSLKSLAGAEVAPGWWTWAVVQDVMEASRSVAEIFSFPSWASMRKFRRWHRSGGVRPVTPDLRGLVGFPLPSRRAAGLRPSPRGAPDVGEVSALRPAARTGEEGAASGEPAGGLRVPYFRSGDRFQPVLGISCPGSGPDREMRCCGPLRASDGGTMAGSGPFRGPLEPGGAGRSGESARLRGRGGAAVVKRPRGGPQDARLSLRSLSLVVLRVAMVLDNEARETALRASGDDFRGGYQWGAGVTGCWLGAGDKVRSSGEDGRWRDKPPG